ncbi:hypothetical protein LUZ61_009593 [Rhynchospora tenuis]|uniref:MADS-box domain-containing protein n=1 Tax=Rhynchospora tenuis TaxID=198213 RepID=A0AAD5ZXP6_9POAL|nr:hypothetical protein LUZ61_009593 [Rhynchospora tenuis]
MENGEASGSSSIPLEKKKIGGKKKIPIELISNKEARQVCFSKRRQGLFKKAKELSVLCGANVKVLTFSPAGKPYPFTSPSEQSDNATTLSNLPDLSRKVSELRAKIDATVKEKMTALKHVAQGSQVAHGVLIWQRQICLNCRQS